ncbi:MAG: helix-turn-helix transcriptional regulator [Chloroflexi bacterium]|nr:helix-turn-helix transcriptional regulator [Chloroflexota bacterium]
MVLPVLATKLYIPLPPSKVVARPRLVERLNEGQRRSLTLISAPAGFGKSTLVSEWVAGCNRPVAWLSLDEGDSDPARFLTYFVAALQTVVANIGEGILSILRAPQPPPAQVILTALVNEIAVIPHKLVLVLDDYHLIDSPAVDDALTFLLEHLPTQMHLVITTREDLQIPLARLRSRGLLTELRASDLRFTPSEAAGFLNEAMGLNLAAEDIDALETRTEGWIAGLQLAAIAIQGHQDVSGFIRAFAGDNRYIVDYLVEEVLQSQPETVRRFLLQTSILDRLNGPLCDAVTGQDGSSTRLEVLERGNFFVVPLDDKRHWYRYHHLFAEVLYARLIAEQPDIVSALHQHASEWYEHHGSAADAIRHALAAGDFERAADLIELAVPAMFSGRQEAMVLGWFRALPDQVVQMRPVLSADYAHALLANGELDAVEARLRDAERWMDQSVDTPDIPADLGARPGSQALAAGMIVVDEEAFRRLPGTIALARARYTFALGDVPGIIKYALRVLDLVPVDDHFSRGAAAAFLGLASWLSGDLEAAHRSYADGMSQLQMAGRTSDAINGAIALADIRIAQGHLHEAMRTYERGLQLATAGFPAARVPAAKRQGAREQTALGQYALRGTADMYVGMSELLRERNELDAATQHLLRSKQLGELIGLPQNRYRWHVAMSRIREAQGDLDGAVDLLGEAERLYMSGLAPNVRPIAALRARVWVAQGRLGEALDWTRERRLSVEDDLSYLREFEHITLARLLLARYKSDHGDRADGSLHEVMGLLERLLQAAEAGERTGSVIEILVLQVLAHETQGDISAALGALQRALTLAEPEGYVRLFVDEGMPMAILLEEAAKRWPAHRYVRRLLAALGAAREAGQPAGAEDGAPVKQGSIEPLSERELEVLRLLRTELTGPEIARELTVSLHTVRTHTSNIYSKLGVDKRQAAVRRAEDLGLF